jgi:hypothetical protein
LSRAVLEDALQAIDEFISGLGDIHDLQSRLEADASALDATFAGVVRELHGLDADLEEILFARRREGQRAAVAIRLAPVRESLVAALDKYRD